MTSKEFLRKVQYYFNWIEAFEVFKLSSHQAAILYRDARFTNLLKTFKNV